MFETDSDYIVEQYIKPTRVAVPLINDERADILGNFDDDDDKHVKKKGKKQKKIKELVKVSEENPFADDDDDDDGDDGDENDEEKEEDITDANEEENENDSDIEAENSIESDAIESLDDVVEEMEQKVADENLNSGDITNVPKGNKVLNEKETEIKKKKKTKRVEKTDPTTSKKQSIDLNDDQIKALIRGASKQDRFVLYITNLNYSTTRDKLQEFFAVAGSVKSIRIPKVRKSAFAFVEMADLNGFKSALALHNRTLDNYTIKVQISEGGKKKSANKKNILKQKNRKLAEMRNEGKQFQRSGKGYDKTIKKEIHQQKMQMNRRIAKKKAKKSTNNS